MRYCLILILLAGLGWPRLAAADEIKTTDGVRYACTGIGESKEDPRWEKFPLKLMFTARGTAYVSFVQVKIRDSNQKTVLSADCDAPWLLVDLPAGTYGVEATALKRFTQKATVQVKAGSQTEKVLRFSQISGE